MSAAATPADGTVTLTFTRTNFLVMVDSVIAHSPDYDGASAPVLFGGSMSDIDSFEDSAPSDVAITSSVGGLSAGAQAFIRQFQPPMMIPAASPL